MAAIVVPSLLSTQALTIQAAARAIIADILNAQNQAVAQQAPRQVIFNTATNSYKLTDGQGNVLTASWKGGGTNNYIVDLSKDSRFQGVHLVKVDFGGGSVLRFDDLGSPDSGGVVDLAFNKWKYQITVAPFTGRVTVKSVDTFN